MSGSTTVLDRAMSPLERWYWIADHISPLSGVLRVRVVGPLTPGLLERALERLQLRQPTLRAAIAPGTLVDPPRFVPCARPIPVRWVSTDEVSEDAWMNESNDVELGHRFDTSAGPLARVVVIAAPADTYDILFNLNHSIADGRSGFALLAELVREAADVHASETLGAPLAPVIPARALPPPEELMPDRVRGALGVLSMLWFQGRDALLDALLRPGRLRPSAWVPFAERKTSSFACAMPPDLLGRLQAKSRQEGASIHGALAAALVRAVAEVDGLPRRGRLSIGSPMDFRSALTGVADDEIGAFAGTLATAAPYGQGESLWSIARYIKLHLDRRRERNEPLALLHVLKLFGPKVPERATRFLKLLDAKGPGNLCLSNMGILPIPSEIGPFAVSGAQVTASLSVFGSLLVLVTASEQQLQCNFAHVEGLVPPARARDVADAWRRHLLSSV